MTKEDREKQELIHLILRKHPVYRHTRKVSLQAARSLREMPIDIVRWVSLLAIKEVTMDDLLRNKIREMIDQHEQYYHAEGVKRW